jgi:hypothetical protein
MILNDSSKELLPHVADFNGATHLRDKKIGGALSSRLLRAALLGRPPVAFTNPKKAM